MVMICCLQRFLAVQPVTYLPMMIKVTMQSWLVFLRCKQPNKMILKMSHRRRCLQ